MTNFEIDLPRHTVATHVGIAALAAIGLTTLTGAESQATLGVPLLTAFLTFALVAVTRPPIDRAASGNLSHKLTGLPIEEAGREALAREFAAAQRGRPLTVVLLRIEALPKYRARYGKAVADQLLRVAGRTLGRHRRGMHMVAHHEGREGTFIAILSATDREGAATYAARVRRDLQTPRGVPEHDGVTVGLAAFDMSMRSPRELVKKAALSLEQAAATG